MPKGGVMSESSMFTMVTMANHRGSRPRERITGKKIGTVMSMMEMGSMKDPMMRITTCMAAMMNQGDTGSSVAKRESPMAAPEWARIWLKAVALVTISRANPETSTVPSRDFRRISQDRRR